MGDVMKIQIKSIHGEVLFEHDCKNNSLKHTVEVSVKQNVSLSPAYLYGANLHCANLYGANLYGADLRGAKITDDLVCDGKFHHITNIGSECGVLELYSCGEHGWHIKRGCFSGGKQEFLDAVENTHGDNEYGRKYRAIIKAICI